MRRRGCGVVEGDDRGYWPWQGDREGVVHDYGDSVDRSGDRSRGGWGFDSVAFVACCVCDVGVCFRGGCFGRVVGCPGDATQRGPACGRFEEGVRQHGGVADPWRVCVPDSHVCGQFRYDVRLYFGEFVHHDPHEWFLNGRVCGDVHVQLAFAGACERVESADYRPDSAAPLGHDGGLHAGCGCRVARGFGDLVGGIRVASDGWVCCGGVL